MATIKCCRVHVPSIIDLLYLPAMRSEWQHHPVFLSDVFEKFLEQEKARLLAQAQLDEENECINLVRWYI